MSILTLTILLPLLGGVFLLLTRPDRNVARNVALVSTLLVFLSAIYLAAAVRGLAGFGASENHATLPTMV